MQCVMEVAATNFRVSTTESVDVRRPSDSSDSSYVDDDNADPARHHCCSALSFKKNILHRYCEYRVNAKL